MQLLSEEYLSHHGIKGQQWGIRRGPPYPIEDTVLKKGTKLNSVSLEKSAEKNKNNDKWMYTYNPNDTWDSSVYKGPFAVYRSNGGRKPLYEHQYEVVSDLKMPTKKERVDEFIKLYENEKSSTIQALSSVQYFAREFNLGSVASQTVNVEKLESDKDYKAAYELFNHAMENAYYYRATQAYSKAMSKKYDAMVDDNNQGVYNGAHDPVIIFNTQKVLKTVGNTSTVTLNEMAKNYTFVQKEMQKQGKRILL